MSKEAVSNNEKALVPKLRFPEFYDSKEWCSATLENLVSTITPPKKLPSSIYSDTGRFPIIDQSKDYICGWTDDEDALIDDGLPVLVFGDHTCELKLVNQSFAQGADGIKVLRVRRQITASFLYQYLLFSPVVMTSYRRHFALLKQKMIPFPGKKTKEQQKIADCLSSLDALIAAHTDKLAALKAHKKGLLQQLFPRDGETLPRLRFPEFRNAGDWRRKTLPQLSKNLDSRRIPITGKDRTAGDIPYYGASGVVGYVADFIFNEELLCISEDGANLVARTSPIAFSISGKTWVNNHAHVLRFDNAFIQTIAEEYLNTTSLEDYLTGVAQPKLNHAMLDTLLIPTPQDASEQQRVANCLSNLNDLITAQTDKIAALKQHKQGLLQQLFPAMDEITE